MEKDKTCGAKIGQFLGSLFACCIGACICAAAVALTIRFIMWVF